MNWQHWIRLSVFLIFTAFMTAGPSYHQFFGGDPSLFRHWTMFNIFGSGTINARFTHLREDGTEVVLNRHALLKKSYKKQNKRRTKWKSRPKRFWLIHERFGGELPYARRLCEVLGSGLIRIDSRIATPTGWVPALEGEVVDCDGENVTE